VFTAEELVNHEIERARAQREHAERQKEQEVEQVKREEQQKVAALIEQWRESRQPALLPSLTFFKHP
jgi:hypothetical protein